MSVDRRTASLPIPERPGSPALGIVVAALAVAATTVLIFPLREVAPAVSTGVVYLIAVLLVSTYFGLWLGLATSVASAAAFNWFHLPPTGRFSIADADNWVALVVFLVAAAIASAVAEVARTRAAEAERRREEADLSAEMARTLLGGATLQEELVLASARLAAALQLPGARVQVGGEIPPDGDVIPLDVGRGRRAALVVPGELDAATAARVRERIAPALEALLSAALDRERLQSEVVETRALRRADVVKTALLRTVSHDLRTPLTSIIAAADAVRSPTVGPEDREELGALIGEEARRLSRLVENLLDLSRIEGGAASPHLDWVSIEDVVRTAIEHLPEGDAAVPIHVSLDVGLPLVQADAAQLERVFVNLLENARRFSGGLPVKVRARVVGGRLKVRVIDGGPGIPSKELPHIFEPFRQVTDSPRHAGSGLGLAIVKGFVEANGGAVEVQSLPGQGTVFAMDFPVPRAGAPEQAAAGAPATGAGS
ncbi:MAG: two-component system, OmpR family, sensor histidine kinase KdpD [Solirubrobacteraceae bacterium]|nr:two-component system, OmpR family, sensor histidine kinase KdpD [Solirubrobacteraceae bacterium]